MHTQLNDELSGAQINSIRSKLDRAEENGFTQDSKESILAQSKSLLKG